MSRLEGHWIRTDVLYSALQKGIRRRDPKLSLWALGLLCRGGLWKRAYQALLHHAFEECSALSEPGLRPSILKQSKRLLPQLMRKGVNLDTESTRRLMFDLCWEITLASKSRLNIHSLLASYAGLADEAKEVREALPAEMNEAILYMYQQFKKAWEAQEERNTLKWLALLDMHADKHVTSGIPRVWRSLEKKVMHLEQIETMRQLFEGAIPASAWTQRLGVFEAVLYSFYPTRPAQLPTVKLTNEVAEIRHRVWHDPLAPALRNLIDWDTYLDIVLDIHTDAGLNRDTLAELLSKQPQFPVLEYAAPDHSGVSHPNYIQHEFTVCQVVRSRMVTDPYETTARHFLANIERGHCLPILGDGVTATLAIREHLAQLLTPLPATQSVSTPLSSTQPFRPYSAGNARRGSESQLSVTSVPQPPPLTRPASADPGRSHISNKTPCPLPGFQVQHQEVVSGPVTLDGLAVTYCQLGEEPQLGRHPRWFVGLSNDSHWVVQRCPEMNSTIPIYLDRIKSRFGLHSTSLRWTDSWLVQADLGPGGPYSTCIAGLKRMEVVDWKAAQCVPWLNWIASEQESNSFEMWIQLLRVLLFRALYGIRRPFAWSHLIVTKGTLYSWQEWAVSDAPLPREAQDYSFLLPSAQEAPESVIRQFTHFCRLDSTREKVHKWLDQWLDFLFRLPPPARPIPNFPTEAQLAQRLFDLRSYWPVPPVDSEGE